MSSLRVRESFYEDKLSKLTLYRETGKLLRNVGIIFEAYLPGAAVGSTVHILSADSDEKQMSSNIASAEVIGFKDKRVILMPLDDTRGMSNSSKVTLSQLEASIPVGDFLLGRVIGGKGEAIDGKGPLLDPKDKTIRSIEQRGIYGSLVNPLDRSIITQPMDLGIRTINTLLTCGKGQRVGIMAGSGVGKSVLLGMMARYTSADINVIALIGERGREVREFIERDLGADGLKRSVVVVVTNDQSPLLRMRGAFIAATIAEYFCDQGKNVLLMMDSVTRFAMAQREIGLSMGEPPASKGYTPSVFSNLPKLLERAGTRAGKGSITGLYTVLVEGDDMDEPIADATRSILDGHITLSRTLASRNHYPAIDVLNSVSRVMNTVLAPEQMRLANEIKDLMATYTMHEDLINIGAYVKGSNHRLDQAISVIERIRKFLKQDISESSRMEEGFIEMSGILKAVQTKL